MSEQRVSPVLANRVLERHHHVCAFFQTPEEEYRVLLPFIKEGIERGEKAFHIVDPSMRLDHDERLARAGISARTADQLEVCAWEDAYLREGRFDQTAMLALIEGVLKRGRAEGFPLTRLVAHMEWALGDYPGVNDLVAYETRLNYILPNYDDPVICTYDLTKFSATTIMDILRTHPMVIIGGILQENPFFVSPDELLEELAARSA
jgi:hypothetical protein